MARLVGVDLPREKRIEIALTYVFGIGRTRATETLAATGISPDKRVHELDDNDLVALRDHIEANYQTEGQRTKTNARTRKGPKRTVAGKKK
jgi:small subunit ribosomal protein S13